MIPSLMARIRGYSVKSGTSTFHLQALIAACTIVLIQHDLLIVGEQQFVPLAKSFLNGHLYFTVFPGRWNDTSYYRGHYYWPLGPLPAIILMPFVAFFGLAVRQGYFLGLVNLSNLFLLKKIAHKITRNRISSLWLSFAYIFGTSYLFIALIPWSWYFAQTISTFFLLLALYEFFNKRRWWLIGLYVAFGVATRIDIIFAGVFFGICIVIENEATSQKMKQLASFFTPIVLSVFLLMAYDFLRFHSIFETGYGLQVLRGAGILAANRSNGLWSFIHFPANLYYFLFRGPQGVFIPGTKVLTYPYLKADGWGMSILFTSPIFFWIFRAPWENTIVRLSVLTSLSMLVFCLGYSGIGYYQYGYRYVLDFFPFLFLILAYAARSNFNFPMKLIAVMSFLFNWYLISFMQT